MQLGLLPNFQRYTSTHHPQVYRTVFFWQFPFTCVNVVIIIFEISVIQSIFPGKFQKEIQILAEKNKSEA